MEGFDEEEKVVNVLKKNHYYGKVYSFDLIFKSIINGHFDNNLIKEFIVYEIEKEFD